MTARQTVADGLVALSICLLGVFGINLGASASRPLFLNFGPNDQDYVTNFRSDWEPEGRTRFHWTLPQAQVELPLRLSGAGHVLRLRARRHFVEPARVTLRVEGRVVARFDLQADADIAWRTYEFPLPTLDGRGRFVLDIEAPSANPRPLGMALDWMEIERTAAGGRVDLLGATQTRLALLLLTLFLAVRAGGLPRPHAAAVAGLAAVATAWAASQDPLALERALREGTGAFASTAVIALGLVRWPRTRAALGLDPDHRLLAGSLVALVLVGLGLRLALLLHPQFYYPDVRIHAVFARELAKTGLVAFLSDFTENQYRFSLGLQYENGHWYAFPYPPLFYALCWPLLRLLRYGPEVAVALLAAIVNSLGALVVFALGRRLALRAAVAALGAAAVPLLPIFTVRLSLAYFPALVGHAADMLLALYLVSRLRRLGERRVVIGLALLLALALLTYTQSLLNWGLLLPLFLLVSWAADRSPEAHRRQLGLLVGGLLGALLSLGFYGRYIPVFVDMQRGIPLAEERILAEKLERAQRVSGVSAVAEEPDDPFSGPTFDLWRGTRKAAWRLFVFYGWFALALPLGLWLLWREAPGSDERRLIACWAALYVLLNWASGALPGPNLVRYNKDLEIVAPLACLAWARLTLALWQQARPLGVVFGGALMLSWAQRWLQAMTEKFFAVR
jgi:hypothetical protein